LKVPERGEQKEERSDGRDEAVNAHRVNKAELKVHEVQRSSGTYSGVKNRAKTQAVRESAAGSTRGINAHANEARKLLLLYDTTKLFRAFARSAAVDGLELRRVAERAWRAFSSNTAG